MALGEAFEVVGPDIDNAAFVNFTIWYQSLNHEIAQPLRTIGIDFVVIDGHPVSKKCANVSLTSCAYAHIEGTEKRRLAMMTLEQFRTTGRDCPDLGIPTSDDSLTGVRGRTYVDALHIQRDGDGWLLHIENVEEKGDLADLEAKLYGWAKDEGWCE